MTNNSDAILTRLKFISKIKCGDKINTRSHLSIQPNNFLTRISRTIILQDSRTNALLFISDTIVQSMEIIDSVKGSHKLVDKNLLKILLIDLKNSKIGIKNLSDTYCDDLIIVSEFQTILQNIDFVLEEFKISKSIPSTPIETPSQSVNSTPSETPQSPNLFNGLMNYEEDDY